ncbi:hypothetical protein BCR35DRAFT_301297 [Leucosporidium creatinivorum]|uniref:Core domain-containing protein n=1 Tax=Leucosporidium creatinivorum TaxID=106004 RepID=A0A1Y2G0U6_9BASI|nr:hypothetical protein BCR35DRAFT_301297 [Leucosporidium creatinivorum]
MSIRSSLASLSLSRCTLCSTRFVPPTPTRSFSLFSSSRPSSRPPLQLQQQQQQARRTILLQAQPPENPSEDFEPVDEGEDTIDLTDSAIKQIARAQAAAKDPSLALRVSVESGGCHGYQYKMEVTNHREEDDYLFLPPSSPSRLLIDSSSLPLISGSTIDYATELIGSSFRVQGNPHASDKGGCGCGVSWELKEE